MPNLSITARLEKLMPNSKKNNEKNAKLTNQYKANWLQNV